MFQVIYRTGGTENFRWHYASNRFRHLNEAEPYRKLIERQGYCALTIIYGTPLPTMYWPYYLLNDQTLALYDTVD